MADEETRRPGSNGSNGSTASMSMSEARHNAHPMPEARAAGPAGHSDSARSTSRSEDGHSDLQAHLQIDTSPSDARANTEQHNSASASNNTAPATTMDASEANALPQHPPQAVSGAVSGAPIDTGTENHIHAARTGDDGDFVEVQLEHEQQPQQQQQPRRPESPAPPEQGTRCPFPGIECSPL
jgi:hypothetical protein